MKGLHILLSPDKELKKVFPNVTVVRIRNGKCIKDYLVSSAEPRVYLGIPFTRVTVNLD